MLLRLGVSEVTGIGKKKNKNKVNDVDLIRTNGGEEGHARNKSRGSETKLKTTRIGRENQSSKYQGIARAFAPCHSQQHRAHGTCFFYSMSAEDAVATATMMPATAAPI